MEILYCGVCHSDLHQARNDWGASRYPMVPGHEIVGRITAIGPEVKQFKVGDSVAVGCMVDSCQVCDQCRKGEEQMCRARNTQTYNGLDCITREVTYGGIAQTQEMLDFCARKNILPDCEMIALQDINQAFERMERADVRYRFVIDMASLGSDA